MLRLLFLESNFQSNGPCFCRRELAKDVVDLLTSAADGAISLIDATDRLILYVEIARLFGTLGYQRKAAFFTRQVAQLYLQQDSKLAAISALQVLAMTTKAYRVQSRASISNNSHINVSIQARWKIETMHVMVAGMLVLLAGCSVESSIVDSSGLTTLFPRTNLSIYA
jgi:hypothetical protein